MSNKENLGKEFVEALTNGANNFKNWVDMADTILDLVGDLNGKMDEIQNVDYSLVDIEKRKIVSVDTFEVDIDKTDIDVSKWNGVKPVKIIMSVITKDNNGEDGLGFSLEFGNIIALMEDGTFRMN